MKPFLLRLFVGILFIMSISTTSAKVFEMVGDSIQISLLTCDPGKEVYELYGHTAIRVKDFSKGHDWVFNYGVFSFKKPNFIWRFIKGETDYELGVVSFRYFLDAYASEGRNVYEQVLNLNKEEGAHLYASLVSNYLPENRVYRYNFLYNNCTNRAINKIEEHIDGEVVYVGNEQAYLSSYRSIIHEFVDGKDWVKLGQDLILGCDADISIGVKEQLFSPIYALGYVGKANITDATGKQRPLVLTEHIYKAEPTPLVSSPFAESTIWIFVLFLLLSFYFSYKDIKRGKVNFLFDNILLFIQGFLGVFLFGLFLVSEHPTVSSNLTWLFFCPISLLLVFVYPVLKYNKDVLEYTYGGFFCVLLLFFVITRLMGQYYPLEIYIWALIFLVRIIAMGNVFHSKYKKIII